MHASNKGLEVKLEVLRRMQALLSEHPNPGTVLGRDVVVGTNSVSRLIEGKGAAVVVVSKDAIHMTKLAGASFMTSPVDKKTGLHSHITEMCLLRGVPLLVVPKMNEELSKVLRIRKASCFAIPTNDYIIKSLAKKKEDHGLESGVDINDSFYGVLDSVRDALAALAMREK